MKVEIIHLYLTSTLDFQLQSVTYIYDQISFFQNYYPPNTINFTLKGFPNLNNSCNFLRYCNFNFFQFFLLSHSIRTGLQKDFSLKTLVKILKIHFLLKVNGCSNFGLPKCIIAFYVEYNSVFMLIQLFLLLNKFV